MKLAVKLRVLTSEFPDFNSPALEESSASPDQQLPGLDGAL